VMRFVTSVCVSVLFQNFPLFSGCRCVGDVFCFAVDVIFYRLPIAPIFLVRICVSVVPLCFPASGQSSAPAGIFFRLEPEVRKT